MGMPFHADLVETVGAATVVAVSVVTAARSTSQRIRVHHAHASAMKAERQAEAERERALLAESAISMERLAASLSHELNTPIGVLKSATHTLVRGVQKRSGFAEGGGARRILWKISRTQSRALQPGSPRSLHAFSVSQLTVARYVWSISTNWSRMPWR
jgi:signal transduction histidine kinase